MFSEETKQLREKMLDDSKNPTYDDSLNSFIAYVLSTIKELDLRLEKIENKS